MIGVIIPAKDEEKNILDVIVNIHEAGIEKKHIYVVDNCSKDGTANIAKKFGVNVIKAHEPGYHNTLKAGLNILKNKNYTNFCIVDGDNEIKKESIEKVLLHINTHDFVCGKRKYIKRIGERAINLFIKILFGIEDLMCGLKGGNLKYYNENSNLEFGIDLFTFKDIKDLKFININTELNIRSETRLGTPLSVNFRMIKSLLIFLFRRL